MRELAEIAFVANGLFQSLKYTPTELNFGTSGLRGLAEDMTDLECYINTLGFMEYVLNTKDIEKGAVVCLAGDLRLSTPRIVQAVAQAIHDSGCKVAYYGLIPTPALAYYAIQHGEASVTVTGSHIPADRNGIKFYKREGEVLKADEAPIKKAVQMVRDRLYTESAEQSKFDASGSFKKPPGPLAVQFEAEREFVQRYLDIFPAATFSGKKIIIYQHSAVGRDLLMEVFKALGAEALGVDRSDEFIPIDTENVTPANQTYFRLLAKTHPDAFAIVSTDGDSDRPFVIDETGTFHRGDVLGVLVAEFLQVDAAAVPISANDAVDIHLKKLHIPLARTKIGSPYVITAMQEASAHGHTRIVGWEVNGGFMLGSDFLVNQKLLTSLPTRDAFLPILCALKMAVEKNTSLSRLFKALPRRYTQAGLIDNFPSTTSQSIISHFAKDTEQNRSHVQQFFTEELGFGSIINIDTTDGIRISFSNGDIAHIRPSGNSPQLRVYSVADSQERADAIVALGVAEPTGILRSMEKTLE